MELEEFIKKTLVGIRNGVSLANDELTKGSSKTRIFGLDSNSKEGGHVHFDVAVTATHESGASGGGGIKVAVVEFGGEKNTKELQESVSRIKFAIKVSFGVD